MADAGAELVVDALPVAKGSNTSTLRVCATPPDALELESVIVASAAERVALAETVALAENVSVSVEVEVASAAAKLALVGPGEWEHEWPLLKDGDVRGLSEMEPQVDDDDEPFRGDDLWFY